MFSNKKKYTYCFLFCITIILFNCQSRVDDGKASNQKFQQGIIIDDKKPGKPVRKDDDTKKVKITAFESGPQSSQERDYYISIDAEKLAIGGHPLTISNIRGLDQLNNVKQLYLYSINERNSDVLNSINVFRNNLEIIVFVGCYVNNLDFLASFPKLRAIVYWGVEIKSNPAFNFTTNPDLEYFYLNTTVFNIVRDNSTGQRKKLSNYTQEEKESITLTVEPSLSMKMIFIDTNAYPIIITDTLLEKLKKLKKVAIYDMAFNAGNNDYGLLKKHKNIVIYEHALKPPDDDVPSEFKFKKLTDYSDFEVIGVM